VLQAKEKLKSKEMSKWKELYQKHASPAWYTWSCMEYLGLAHVFVHIASAHFPHCKFASCNDAPRRNPLTAFPIMVALFHLVISVMFPIAVSAILLNI
jgi:hypothetical protein